MPTFQSIGLHPELRSRLVTCNKIDGAIVPVDTPQALLLRKPTALKLLRPENEEIQSISLPNVKKLRQQVANAVILETNHGRRIHHIRDVVMKEQPNDDDDDNNNNEFSGVVLEGALSALTAIRYEELRDDENHRSCFTTKCPALDDLVAVPLEYSDCSTRTDRQYGSQTGIPVGYVTQFSGPPWCGKTQLALQVLASSPSSSSCSNHCWVLGKEARPLGLRLSELMPQREKIDRFHLIQVSNDEQLLSALTRIDLALYESSRSKNNAPALLLIDSLSTFLSSEYEDTVRRISMTLKRMARQYPLAVIVTSGSCHSTKDFGVPGRSSCWHVDVDVVLQGRSNGVYEAFVARHFAKKRCSDKKVQFRIQAGGIVPA